MDDLDRLGAVSDRGLEWAEAFLHEYRQRVGESFELEWALSTVGAGAPGDAQAAGRAADAG